MPKSGEEWKFILYVDDMADGRVFLMENVNEDDIKKIAPKYFRILGIGEDIKFRNLALLIKNAIDFEGSVKYD